MKKNLLLLSTTLMAFLIIGTTGCKDDDTTAPIVSLTGSSSMEVVLGTSFTDPGASANDDEDGAIEVVVTGTVNTNQTGTYTLTYTATDEAGNVGTEIRTVRVYNEAEIFAGTYLHCVDTCAVSPPSSYEATVTISETVNKRVTISNFGAFGTSISIVADFTAISNGSAINIATGQSLGTTALLTTVNTSATQVISASVSATSFKVGYVWTDGAASEACTSYYIR